MAISAKDAIKKYKVKLLRELPLDETLFFAMVEEADLLPLSTGSNIKAEKTRADKVAYFLQYVIEPAADTYLPRLLDVMKHSEVANVEKLAGDIEALLEPGMYICVYMYICILSSIKKILYSIRGTGRGFQGLCKPRKFLGTLLKLHRNLVRHSTA